MPKKKNYFSVKQIICNFQVSAVPELVAMKGGKVLGKMIGLQDEDKLKTFVSKLIETEAKDKQ